MCSTLDDEDDAIGPKLLADIRQILDDRGVDRIFSDDIVTALKDIEDHPWADWGRGKGLSQNGLARLLRPYKIHSKTIRIGDDRRKGYDRKNLEDAFKRYLVPIPPISTVTPCQTNDFNNLDNEQSVTSADGVTDEKQYKHLDLFDCHDVTDEIGDSGGKNREEVF